jgi:hypothetical protein
MQSAFEDVKDAAQNATIIHTRHTAHILRQQRFDLLELFFAEPEQVAQQDLQGKDLFPKS